MTRIQIPQLKGARRWQRRQCWQRWQRPRLGSEGEIGEIGETGQQGGIPDDAFTGRMSEGAFDQQQG